MATGPKLPTDPLEILTPDLSRPEPFINKYWGGAVTAILFGGCSLFTNLLLKKPVLSGMHWHLGLIAIGAVSGQYFDEKRRDYLAEKDAVLRHYVQLHPEDFPSIERQKYSELLLPWQPVR